jgi:RNA polymerase sigma-70 factor (ECF subfamily)
MADEKQEDILKRLKENDRSALKELFQLHYLPVCQTIQRLVRDQSTVEDLAQEVFLRFWNKRHQIHIKSSLSAYIRRMAANEALGYLRSRKIFEEEEVILNDEHQSGQNVEEQALHTELEDHIKAAINELPPKCRTVFVLSRFEELTYQEIADRMDISIKTVENQMGRALRILRTKLKSYLYLLL